MLPNTPLLLGAPAYAKDWIDSTGAFTPNNGNGDTYLVRLNFTVDPVQNNRTITIELDIGPSGSPIIVHTDERRLSVNSSIPKPVSFQFPFFALGTFFANGGRIMISVDGGNTATIYDYSMFLVKTYSV